MQDEEQEIASKYIENDSIIIAGAGCGKTTTLTKKISYLIRKGIKENEILVISFTNETVKSFKEKCAYNVDVYTFHKLALKYIYDRHLDIIPDGILDEIIFSTLNNLPKKLKIKLYNIFNIKKLWINDKTYNKFIDDKSSYSIYSYIKSVINTINSENIFLNKLVINNFTKNERLLLYTCSLIISEYNKIKRENGFIDFDDIIKLATECMRKEQLKLDYKQILVDEYQDISKIRLEFLKVIIKKSKAILTVVGDDFQSIYGFSGSNVELFYDYIKDFPNAKTFYITKTYRCPQKIINVACSFIMKNDKQIKKKLISQQKNTGMIKIIETKKVKIKFKKFINKIISENNTYLILSRNNFDINHYLSDQMEFKDTYLKYNNKIYYNIRFLTIHKSKGLEADNVLILNLTRGTNGFPSTKENSIVNKIKNNNEIKYAEERRLMYVAMTRARNKLFFLIDSNNKSIFVKEIKKLVYKN